MTQACIRMLFASGQKRPKSVTFDLSLDYCNLKDKPEHRKAKDYLKCWGIARV